MLNAALFSPFIDPWLLPHGFRRQGKQPRYRRSIGMAIQHIEIDLQGRHLEHPGAVAVYPWLEVRFPELDSAMEAMLGETRLGSMRLPMESTAEKRAKGSWLVLDQTQVHATSAEVGQFISDWVLPFLSEYTTVADLIRGELNQDERLIRDHQQVLRAIAAMLITVGPTAALEHLEWKFSKPALRNRFAQAFQYLESRRLN